MVVKVIRVLWKDNLNGKALVKIEELHDSKKLVGIFDHFQYDIGITLEIDGIETDNPKYGPTIEVTRYTLVLTTEAAGIEFLQCGLGLRLIDAQKVVTYCKGNIKNLLKEEHLISLIKSEVPLFSRNCWSFYTPTTILIISAERSIKSMILTVSKLSKKILTYCSTMGLNSLKLTSWQKISGLMLMMIAESMLLSDQF